MEQLSFDDRPRRLTDRSTRTTGGNTVRTRNQGIGARREGEMEEGLSAAPFSPCFTLFAFLSKHGPGRPFLPVGREMESTVEFPSLWRSWHRAGRAIVRGRGNRLNGRDSSARSQSGRARVVSGVGGQIRHRGEFGDMVPSWAHTWEQRQRLSTHAATWEQVSSAGSVFRPSSVFFLDFSESGGRLVVVEKRADRVLLARDQL